jgi:hypothetical protein
LKGSVNDRLETGPIGHDARRAVWCPKTGKRRSKAMRKLMKCAPM